MTLLDYAVFSEYIFVASYRFAPALSLEREAMYPPFAGRPPLSSLTTHLLVQG